MKYRIAFGLAAQGWTPERIDMLFANVLTAEERQTLVIKNLTAICFTDDPYIVMQEVALLGRLGFDKDAFRWINISQA